MILKKGNMLFLWMVAAFMLIQMTVCQAGGSIPREDVALGGIPLNATEEYVRSVYGAPDDISYKTDGAFGKTRKFVYGTSFFVTFNNRDKVIDVMSNGNNGLKTPPGFAVGMPMSEVKAHYGSVGYDNQGKDGIWFIRYSSEWGVYIKYTADEDEMIKEIHAYIQP